MANPWKSKLKALDNPERSSQEKNTVNHRVSHGLTISSMPEASAYDTKQKNDSKAMRKTSDAPTDESDKRLASKWVPHFSASVKHLEKGTQKLRRSADTMKWSHHSEPTNQMVRIRRLSPRSHQKQVLLPSGNTNGEIHCSGRCFVS